MSEHFPALQVLIPLLAAPACLLLRGSRRAVRVLALLAVWASLFIAAALLHQVLTAGPFSYDFGGWRPPYGIEYRVDAANAYVLLIVTAIASVVLPFGPGGAGMALGHGRRHLFYASFLLCLAGLLGITITGDAFNVFVFLEISSLASYTLISMGRRRRALTAAFSYLIMGTVGSTFLLIGIGLTYQMTGTLNMADLAARLPAVATSRTVQVAFAFVVVGLGIKLAVFPLHQWLPNAYTYAPAAVSAFLAATATKVSYYVLARFVFTIFGTAFVFGAVKMHWLLIPLSLAAMFMGSLAAIYQPDVRRLLAYSSIAQIGYMTLGLSLGTLTGLTGGLVHLFNHGLTKGGMFLALACVGIYQGASPVPDLRGLGRRMPLAAAAFLVGGLGLIGVPGTAGFVSKWYLVKASLEKGWVALAFLILLSSLLAVVYVWKVVEIMYFKAPPTGAPACPETPRMWLPTWILIGATLVFGLYTGLTARVAEAAARQLMGLGVPGVGP